MGLSPRTLPGAAPVQLPMSNWNILLMAAATCPNVIIAYTPAAAVIPGLYLMP